MPIFEYNCLKCSKVFEILHLSADEESAICPKCGANDTAKILSSFAAHTSSTGAGVCAPESCGMPPGPDGIPPCGAGGGCSMM